MSRRPNQEASLQDIQNSINQLATNTNNAISDLAAQVQALAAAASANAANLQQLQQNQQQLQQNQQQLQQNQQQAGAQGAPQAAVTFAISPGTSNQSDDGGTPEQNIIVAAALYKVIMKLTTLDTKITDKALRDIIQCLPAYCLQVHGDIDKVHTRFNNTYAQLKARGEDVSDKEALLFNTYAQVPDKDYRDYMKRQKDDYYDNAGDMKNATYLTIMKKAAGKYNTMKQDATHTWGGPSEEDQKVIALEALLDKNLKLTKDLQAKLKAKDNNNNDGQSNEGGGGGKTKTKNKKNTSNKKRQKEDEAWKKVAPKDSEPKSKQVGKKARKHGIGACTIKH
eukprot:scaffold658_cov52-Cyclotella_meneghiniana.AAC.1